MINISWSKNYGKFTTSNKAYIQKALLKLSLHALLRFGKMHKSVVEYGQRLENETVSVSKKLVEMAEKMLPIFRLLSENLLLALLWLLLLQLSHFISLMNS